MRDAKVCNSSIVHVMNCEECLKFIQHIFAQRAGSTITKDKQEASRLNGLKGGRPKRNA